MENAPTLSPPLIAFILLSFVLCIWAIVDIFRSAFTRVNKLIWILVVLFAPFGIFIYLFVGRRLKPVAEAPGPDTGQGGNGTGEAAGPGTDTDRKGRWAVIWTMAVLAVLCVIAYFNLVFVLGREKTGFVLLLAMVLVGVILTVLSLKGRKKGE